jgi:hypothetical protein
METGLAMKKAWAFEKVQYLQSINSFISKRLCGGTKNT